MPELRPLPPVPNIEFERKEAKLLLRQLRAGDHKATERARIRHSAVSHIYASDFKLADAQLTIAREYGFASWPRMVRYFSTAERQRHRKISHTSTPSGYEHHARALLAAHAKRRTYVGRTLAEYVPRFFGVPLTAVFDATVTEEEAKLAVAREAGFPTWDVLLAKAARQRQTTTTAGPSCCRSTRGYWRYVPFAWVISQHCRRSCASIQSC